MPQRYHQKKNSLFGIPNLPKDRKRINQEAFISQQFTLDPTSLLEATREAQGKANNYSFNMNENSKIRDNGSDRSEIMSRKIPSIKSIQMPKVSPFAKSIPIKKYPIKLFSEEDEYLCK